MEKKISIYTVGILLLVVMLFGVFIGSTSVPSEVEIDEELVLTQKLDSTRVADSLSYHMEMSDLVRETALKMGRISAGGLSFISNDTTNILSETSLDVLYKVDEQHKITEKMYQTISKAIGDKYDSMEKSHLKHFKNKYKKLKD